MKTISQKHKLSISVAAVIGAVATTPASAQQLTIVGWGGTTQAAHNVAYFGPFMEETGIVITEDEWNGEMAKVRAMVDVGAVTWDLVQVEGPEAAQGCDEGVFQPLDWTRIEGGEGNLVDGAATECGAGVLIWSTIFAYDRERIHAGPTNWSEFWDLETWPGRRGMRRGAKMTLEFALLADGVPRDEVYDVLATADGVERAFRKLDEIKPDIVWWSAGAEPQQLLASGEVAMTVAYNAWIYNANVESDQNFEIVWDDNLYSMDYWMIPAGAPNIDEAYQFISFALRPEQQAIFFNRIAYGWTADGTGELVNPDMLPHLPSADGRLDHALETSDVFWLEHGTDLETRFESWLAR